MIQAGVACAEIMRNDGILENVAARSKELFDALHKLQKSSTTGHLFTDVRGLGLMVGVEFAAPASITSVSSNKQSLAKVPEKIASRVQAKCLEKGMVSPFVWSGASSALTANLLTAHLDNFNLSNNPLHPYVLALYD